MTSSICNRITDTAAQAYQSLKPKTRGEKAHASIAAVTTVLGAIAFGLPGALVFGGAAAASYITSKEPAAPLKQKKIRRIQKPVSQTSRSAASPQKDTPQIQKPVSNPLPKANASNQADLPLMRGATKNTRPILVLASQKEKTPSLSPLPIHTPTKSAGIVPFSLLPGSEDDRFPPLTAKQRPLGDSGRVSLHSGFNSPSLFPSSPTDDTGAGLFPIPAHTSQQPTRFPPSIFRPDSPHEDSDRELHSIFAPSHKSTRSRKNRVNRSLFDSPPSPLSPVFSSAGSKNTNATLSTTGQTASFPRERRFTLDQESPGLGRQSSFASPSLFSSLPPSLLNARFPSIAANQSARTDLRSAPFMFSSLHSDDSGLESELSSLYNPPSIQPAELPLMRRWQQ